MKFKINKSSDSYFFETVAARIEEVEGTYKASLEAARLLILDYFNAKPNGIFKKYDKYRDPNYWTARRLYLASKEGAYGEDFDKAMSVYIHSHNTLIALYPLRAASKDSRVLEVYVTEEELAALKPYPTDFPSWG